MTLSGAVDRVNLTLSGRGPTFPVVSQLLGHAGARMTLRYAHVADRDVEAAAERVGAGLAEALTR